MVSGDKVQEHHGDRPLKSALHVQRVIADQLLEGEPAARVLDVRVAACGAYLTTHAAFVPCAWEAVEKERIRERGGRGC